MGELRWGGRREFGPYSALLAALVLFIALMPILDNGGIGSLLIRIGFDVVLLAGLGVARNSRRFLTIAVVLVGANLAVQWLAHLLTGNEESRQLLRLLFGAVYLSYLVVVLVRALARHEDATIDTVLGGINVYLLLALAFMQMHALAEWFEPGSYVHGGVALSDPASGQHGALQTTLTYFSFTTLTTLGYGDISPAKPVAQFLCAAEALIGQLYVAIFIGGLVALRIGGRQRASSDERSP